MSAALRDALRRGWCPGALRPMQTGDGLLVRLRITAGILPAALARNVADASRCFGNGLLDLSARANLQLRGVSEASLPGLTDRLGELGLLDADPAAESVRNVLASPLAGLAPDAVLDIRPVVRALEARLSADVALHALPGKFGFLVDDGSRPGLGGIGADIRFEAGPGPRFLVRLAGGAAASRCVPEQVPDVAAALAASYLALRGEGETMARRMAALVAAIGDVAVFEKAGITAEEVAPVARAPADGWGIVPTGTTAALGVGAPFGRFRAADLERLAGIAEADGIAELRLSPFRAILLPGLPPDRAGQLARVLASQFIVSADDPRLSVAACPGAPACGNATTPAQDDALALAAVAHATVGRGLAVHVSGCAKGCAHPSAAPVTLIGRDGRYDFVQNGSAADEPVLTGMTIEDARQALAALALAGKDFTT
jgi:precorrin-3B synthase